MYTGDIEMEFQDRKTSYKISWKRGKT